MTAPYRDAQRPTATEPRVAVRWIAREPPLAPVGVAGFGAVAVALRERLLRASDEALSALRGVAGEGVLVVTGEAAALPWVEGARWLGRDLAAPSLLLPTSERPSVDVGLFERALLREERDAAPIAVFARDGAITVISLAEARPVSREVLQRALGAEAP